MIWLVNIFLYFYSIILQHEFSNRKMQLCQVRSQWFQQITVQEYLYGESAILHLTFGSCTSPTDNFPSTYHPFNVPSMWAVENFQCFRFGDIQSPDKFTGKPKRTTIMTKFLMGIRTIQQEVGEDGIKVEVAEENMKDELNCYYNGGVDAYLLQSVAMHFNHTVYIENFPIIFSFRTSVIFCIPMTLVIPYWNLKLFSLQLSSDKNYMNSFLNLYNYRVASPSTITPFVIDFRYEKRISIYNTL